MLAQEYLRRILKARVYDVAQETPLDYAVHLSEKLDNKVLLKREDLQPVFLSSCGVPITAWCI